MLTEGVEIVHGGEMIVYSSRSSFSCRSVLEGSFAQFPLFADFW